MAEIRRRGMTKNQKEGCLFMSIGALAAFWLILYWTVKVIAFAWGR